MTLADCLHCILCYFGQILNLTTVFNFDDITKTTICLIPLASKLASVDPSRVNKQMKIADANLCLGCHLDSIKNHLFQFRQNLRRKSLFKHFFACAPNRVLVLESCQSQDDVLWLVDHLTPPFHLPVA